MDARACERVTTDPWMSSVKVVLPVCALATQAVSGIRAALEMAGVESKAYELHSAVSCALETQDAAARWVRGEPVFAACTPGDHGANPKLVAARVRELRTAASKAAGMLGD